MKLHKIVFINHALKIIRDKKRNGVKTLRAVEPAAGTPRNVKGVKTKPQLLMS